MTAIGRAVRACFSVVALVAVVWVLAVPLAHALPTPVSAAPARWRAWLASTEPTGAAFSVLRLAALVMASVETAVVVVVALTSVGRLAPGLPALLPRPLVSVAVVVLGAAAAGCSRPVLTPGPRPGNGPPPTVTISAVAPDTAPAVPAPPPPPGPSRPRAPRVAGPATAARVAVRPGDSMWLIAEQVVSEAGGDPGDTRVVGAYWVALLRANPLPDPNMVYPNQIVVVPPFGQKGE